MYFMDKSGINYKASQRWFYTVTQKNGCDVLIACQKVPSKRFAAPKVVLLPYLGK